MPQALNTLGQSYMAKGDFEKSVQYFLKALEREPDVAARYWNVAIALEQAKKYDIALQYANTYASLERDPAGHQRATPTPGTPEKDDGAVKGLTSAENKRAGPSFDL